MSGPARRAALAGLVVSLAVILGATLLPDATRPVQAPRLCLFCGETGSANFLLNVALFMPPAFALAALGASRRNALFAGAALSLAIETAQALLPGRYPTLGDLVSNSAGALLGAQLWVAGPRLLLPGPARRRLAWMAAAALAAWSAGAALLLRPALTDSIYFGQWTAEIEGYQQYRGRVLEAAIGGRPLPSAILQPSDTIRALLANGVPLNVLAIAGPAPGDRSLLFSIADLEQRFIVRLGPDGDDLLFVYRSLADQLRFQQPELILHEALRGIAAGDTLRVSMSRSTAGVCLAANARRACGLRFALGDTWRLLLPLPRAWRGWGRVLAVLWVAALLLPLGWYGLERRAFPAILGGAVGLIAVAATSEALALTAGDLAGALLGLGLGGAGAFVVARRNSVRTA